MKYLVTGSTVLYSDEYDMCDTVNTMHAALKLAHEWLDDKYQDGDMSPIIHTKILLQIRGKRQELIKEFFKGGL